MFGVICKRTGKAIAAKLEGHYCPCERDEDCPLRDETEQEQNKIANAIANVERLSSNPL